MTIRQPRHDRTPTDASRVFIRLLVDALKWTDSATAIEAAIKTTHTLMREWDPDEPEARDA